MKDNAELPVLLNRKQKKGIKAASLSEEKEIYNGELTKASLQELRMIQGDTEYMQKLSDILLLKDYKTNARNSIELDLYFCVLNDWGFTEEKLLVFFTIVKQLHKHVTEPFSSVETSFEKFKALLLQHTVLSQQLSEAAVFSLEEAKLITDYVTNSYFQHFQLYKYVFTKIQEIERHTCYVFVETAMEPIPLNNFKPASEWKKEQEKAQRAKELREMEAKNLYNAVEEALLAESFNEKERESLLKKESVISADSIVKLAITQANNEVDSLKEMMKQKFNEQEKNLLEFVGLRLEEQAARRTPGSPSERRRTTGSKKGKKKEGAIAVPVSTSLKSETQ